MEQKERLVSAFDFTKIIQERKQEFILQNKEAIARETIKGLIELAKKQNIMQDGDTIGEYTFQAWQKKKLNDFLLFNLAVLDYAETITTENIQKILLNATSKDMEVNDYIKAVVNHELQINTLADMVYDTYKRLFDNDLISKELSHCKKCNLKYPIMKKLLMVNLNKACCIAQTITEILFKTASEVNQLFKQGDFDFKLKIDDRLLKELGLDNDLIALSTVATNNSKEDIKEIKYEADVKKLEAVAIELGYTFVRQTGSHRIYKKNTSEIVIPYHTKDIGKGLSLKIQKEIINY